MSNYRDSRDRAQSVPGRTSGAGAATVGVPGKRTLTQDLAPVVRTTSNTATPTSEPRSASPAVAPTADEAQILDHQAKLKNTDVEIAVLEGTLLTTRLEAVKRGLLSKSAFDASLDLSQAMTQLQPAAAAGGPVDVSAQVIAINAAQRLFLTLQRDTADDKNFHLDQGQRGSTSVNERNPYTGEARVVHAFGSSHLASPLQQLPTLIHQAKWELAFPAFHELMAGLDRWVADQLRAQGTGTPDEARGNAHQYHAQLRAGLDEIAGKHATRLPALFRPDPETIETDKVAGRPVVDAVPVNLYVWKDAEDGKYHIYDLTIPARPHEQAIAGPPTAATMNTFFEEVARYPKGAVRYTLPNGAVGLAQTTGKPKWYEWLGYAGLAAAGLGLAIVTVGASIPATICFAAGALAGGVSAAGHLVDSGRLGTATTATVVLDVAQIATSFASAGAMNLAVKAGSVAGALANSRYFIPLVTADAVGNAVQLVALTDITFVEMSKIRKGAGSEDDKQRAVSVLLTQLIVTGGLTALSVRGARDARAIVGKSLELIEQNGAQVLRVEGDTSPAPANAPAGEAHTRSAETASDTEGTAHQGTKQAEKEQIGDGARRIGRIDERSSVLDPTEERDLTTKGATPYEKSVLARILAIDPPTTRRLLRVYGEELLERLATQPFTNHAELEAALAKQRLQVTQRVQGLYEGIERPPEGWQFVNDGGGITTERDGTRLLGTRVFGPNRAEGYFERAYNPNTKTLELRMAFLKMRGQPNGLPNMIKGQGPLPEMIEGKGTPTVQYVTLYQMKMLGVPLGGEGSILAVKAIHLSRIQNAETVAHLHYLCTTVGGEVSELVTHTASVKYAETTAIQSGYRRIGTPIVRGGRRAPIRQFLDFQEAGNAQRRAENDAILAKYGATRDMVMFWDFDIDFDIGANK